MSILHLELPSDTAIAPEFLRSLNERFLRIADALATGSGSELSLQGAHVLRIATPAEKQSAGRQFWEQDRNCIYIVRQVNKALVWAFEAGMMAAGISDRPADLTLYDAGFLYYDTGRTVLHRWSGSKWVYLWGTMRDTLANKPTLGTGDAGFLFHATDYRHTWRWSGSAWDWAPGDDGSDYFRYCRGNPGTGWHLCDGSAGIVLCKSDATTTTLTLPDLTGGAYLKGGAAYTGTVNAAGTVSLSGNTGDTSGGTPAGTNSAPALTMNSYTPAGTISTPTFTGSAMGTHQHDESVGVVAGAIYWSNAPFGTGSTQTVTGNATTAGGAGTFAVSKTSAVSAGTPAGTVSTPTFTGTAATLTGSVAAPTFSGTALAAHHHDLSGATAAFVGDAVKNMVVLIYYRQ